MKVKGQLEDAQLEISNAAPTKRAEIKFSKADLKIKVNTDNAATVEKIAWDSDLPTSVLDLGITDGTSGQVLTTNGAGVMTFTAKDPGGADPIVSVTASGMNVGNDIRVSMATPGQVLTLGDDTFRDEKKRIVKFSGEPFRIVAGGTGQIKGTVSLELIDDGDYVEINQLSSLVWEVVSIHRIKNNPGDIKVLNPNASIDLTGWTFVDGPSALGVGSITRNTTNPINGVSDFKVSTTALDTAGTVTADMDYAQSELITLSNASEKKQNIFFESDFKYTTNHESQEPAGSPYDIMDISLYEGGGTLVDTFRVISDSDGAVGIGDSNIYKLMAQFQIDASAATTYRFRVHSMVFDSSVENIGWTSTEYQLSNVKVRTEVIKEIGVPKKLNFKTNNNTGASTTLPTATNVVVDWETPVLKDDPYLGWDAANDAYEFKKDCRARVETRFRTNNGSHATNTYLIAYITKQSLGIGAWNEIASGLTGNAAAGTNTYATSPPCYAIDDFKKGDKVRIHALQNLRASAVITQSATISSFTVEEE